MCWMCDARRVALAMYEQAGVKVTGRAAPDALHFDYEVGMDGSGRATAANTLSRPEPDGPTINDRARQFEEARENYEQRVEEFRAARQVMEDLGLDEILFQQQGLRLAGGHRHLNRLYTLHQRLGFRA